VLFAFTAALTLAAQIFMPSVLLLVHGGYASDKDNYDFAVLLTRITMPYLTCMALAALLSGVLNSAERYILSAGAPTLLNISLIAAALLGDGRIETSRFASFAIVIAGIAQVGLLWWGVSRQKLRIGLIGWPRLTPDVKKVMALAVPGMIAGSATQINILISQQLASFEVSAKSWLANADRLYQLPLGLVGVAVGIAILPSLSRAARAGDEAASARTMDEGLGLSMALTLPAAAALMMAPVFLVEAFFVRGAFTLNDAVQSGGALFHFAWGVPAFVLIKVLAPPYFARGDTKTPMRFAIASVVINTLAGAALFFWFKSIGVPGFRGLAIATSLAAWVNAGLLAWGLYSRGWYRPGPGLISGLTRAGLATLLMSALIGALLWQRPEIQSALGGSKELTALVIVLSGMTSYGLFALLTGAVRLSDLRRLLRR
jgi:putative peptidoglycan lipid II flippase